MARLTSAVLVVLCVSEFALGQNPSDRANTSQKGSLLIFPKIELRWRDLNGNGVIDSTELATDTILTLSNDGPATSIFAVTTSMATRRCPRCSASRPIRAGTTCGSMGA
ncbi:MAG: hypothetical protein CHACPFDD_01165 [Phycisphaerae bacterium]|nr:hypothetical protein [Phycisphaerae bacterium]